MEASNFNLQQSMAVKTTDQSCSADLKCSKKPHKALPCPRCNSLDTKFCYFNNYNVNQPRHFCKGCQRYWTAGGSLRNVAIGAGRRKRKHSSLESDSGGETALVDCRSPQVCSASMSSSIDCKSLSSFKDLTSGGHRADGIPQNKFHFSMDSSFFASDSLSTEGNLPKNVAQSTKIITSQHSLGPIHGSLMQLNPITVLEDKHLDTCKSVEHICKSFNHSEVFDAQTEGMKDVGSKLVLAMPSEMQASNESGCASSLTTQALSEDACTNGGKSDVESEISKEGGNWDKGGNANCVGQRFLSQVSCKMAGEVPAAHGSSQGDLTNLPTGLSEMQSWKAPWQYPEFGTAWTMLPTPPFWSSPADRQSLLWGSPWGPTASAVDAAKASLVPNARAAQKPWSQPSVDLVLNSGSVIQNESETSKREPSSSEMRVWVPKTLRLKDVDEAARRSIWLTLGITDKQGWLPGSSTEEAFHCRRKEGETAAVQMQNANPVALAQSMAFQESA